MHMKKIFLVALSLLFALTISACVKPVTTTLTTTTTIETTTDELTSEQLNVDDVIQSYTEDVTFDVYGYNSGYNFPEVYIDINFTLISYSPVQNEICIKFDVHDQNPAHATYYAIMQDTAHYLTREQQQFFGGGNNFTAGACFDISDRSMTYRIIVGKYDTDNLNRTPGKIEASAWIEWHDPYWTSRNTFDVGARTNTTEEYSESLTESNASFEFTINDPDDCISNILVVLREPLGTMIDYLEFDASTLKSGDNINVSGGFDGLAPYAEYTIEVYVDGNDGHDDFNQEYLFQMTLRTAKVLGQEDMYNVVSYHGLFAVIYDIEYTETEAILHYVYVNEDRIKYADSEEYLYLHLEYASNDGSLIHTYELLEGDNTLTVPIEDICEGYIFSVYDQQNSSKFAITRVPSLEPSVSIYGISHNQFEIRFNGSYDNITNFDLEIYIDGYAACIESYENIDIFTNRIINLYHDFSEIDNSIIFIMTITYEAYGKEITFIESDSMY